MAWPGSARNPESAHHRMARIVGAEVSALATTAIGALRVATADEDQLAHKLVDDLATVQRHPAAGRGGGRRDARLLVHGGSLGTERASTSRNARSRASSAEIRARRLETAAGQARGTRVHRRVELLALQRAVDADPRELVPQFDENGAPEARRVSRRA